jgi:hypothetical protein
MRAVRGIGWLAQIINQSYYSPRGVSIRAISATPGRPPATRQGRRAAVSSTRLTAGAIEQENSLLSDVTAILD